MDESAHSLQGGDPLAGSTSGRGFAAADNASAPAPESPTQPGDPGVRTVRTMPVLYSNPVPLSRESHATKGLRSADDYSFAAGTNAIPLNGAQFPMAMRDYPIVFAGEETMMAVAVVGLRESENLFVDAAGRWAADTYVPAYVRRFPFIFLSGKEGAAGEQRYVLCVEDGAGHVAEMPKSAKANNAADLRPFFEDGEPSAVTRRALEFCRTYQSQSDATKAFAAALREAGLLKPNRARISLPSGEALSLSGFQVIDEAAWDALPGETFLAWRAKGWIPLVYWHFASMQNWRRLLARAEPPGTPKKAAGAPADKTAAANKPVAKKPAAKTAARKAPKLKTGAAAKKG